MKYDSEIFDELQFLFEVYKFNDHQLHCIMNFDNKINKEVMKKAVILTLEVVPILGSVYVENVRKPYWERMDNFRYEDVIAFVNNEDEFNSFITSRTNELTGPQVKACLLSSYKDSLAIVMNHMVCDAAGFKEYLYLLSNLYSKLIKDPDYLPDYKVNGDRSINRVNEQFNFKDKIKAFVFEKNRCNKTSKYKFPMSLDGEAEPFILTHRISENRYRKIRDYCKLYNVTINDVVLAAYYRVIYNLLSIKDTDLLNIAIMVDMRKHLTDWDMEALCNLTSTVATSINHKPEDNFNDSVMKVNKEMNKKKNNYIGLEGFIKISMAFKVLNYRAYKKVMKTGFKNPLIGMTNIGVLDSKKLSFEGASISEAFMCGSIKYPPYFQLALSSYKESITFSVNLQGSLKDRESIEQLFILLDKELPE